MRTVTNLCHCCARSGSAALIAQLCLILCCLQLSSQPTSAQPSMGLEFVLTDKCGWVHAGGVDMPGVALLPVGDLLDHDPERHVSWHTGSTGTAPFSFISHSPISKASPANHHELPGTTRHAGRHESVCWHCMRPSAVLI